MAFVGFNEYRSFLFFACKMNQLEIGGKDLVIIELYITLMNQLQEEGKLLRMTKPVVQTMLSIQMAIGDTAIEKFWLPLLEFLALSLEQRVEEDPNYTMELHEFSNLLSILARKENLIRELGSSSEKEDYGKNVVERIYKAITATP
jgi:hypothetical protein